MNLRQNRAAKLVTVATLATAVGCATIDPAPFEEYRNAFLKMQSSSDKVLSVDYEWTYETYLEKMAKGENVSPTDLILEFPVGDYGWTLPSGPLFAKIQRAKSALSMLNAAFSQYTELLVQLAGGALSDGETFDELAEELNRKARSAAETLQIDPADIDKAKDELALFSATSMALARQYISNQRKNTLRDIIATNQSSVELFAGEASAGVKIVARDLKAEYLNKVERLMKSWPGASAAKRKKLTEGLVDLNSELIEYLKTLETLDRSYGVLARKHAELGTSLSTGDFSVEELVIIADQLRDRYEELKTAR